MKNDLIWDDPKTPEILRASYYNLWSDVAMMICLGHDVNAVDARYNLTPLHVACVLGHENVVDFILDLDATRHNVDFDIKSAKPRRLAWESAWLNGHEDIATKVLSAWKAARNAQTIQPQQQQRKPRSTPAPGVR